ncbi:MAG: hypothetical protein AAF587_35150 [Bacteroidota bacterium]
MSTPVFRLQKTIISKYLVLTEKEVASQEEIESLLSSILRLYELAVLNEKEIWDSKLQLVLKSLKKDFEAVKRKRKHKAIPLEINPTFKTILQADLDGIDYSKSDLDEIAKVAEPYDIQINLKTVLLALKHLVIPKRKLSNEADLEKLVNNQLAQVFDKTKVHRQYNIGGFLALKTDLDIGNGQIGIEMKIAEKLNASEMQRLIGQVVYYQRRIYEDKLVVFIAGKKPMDAKLIELKKFIEELNTAFVYSQGI